MSRVEDERDAQRIAQQQLLKQRQETARTADGKLQESVFARKIQEGTTARSKGDQRQGEQQAEHEKSAEAFDQQSNEELLHATEQYGLRAREQAKARGEGRAFQAKLNKGGEAAQAKAGQSRVLSEAREGVAQSSRAGTEDHSQKRSDDETQGERGSGKRQDAMKRGDAFTSQAKSGGLKTESDAKKGGGQDQKDDQDGKNLAPSFRLNPALLAPVPVAQPKETSASERLRALANEIAQKIVERVRIGTNAAGAAEFQIELKSTVLSGLSIKISGGKGRIKALFQGRDREVLKMLQEQSEGLEAALKSRGLVLEELKIEARA